MRLALLLVGSIIALVAVINLAGTLPDYGRLTPYGQGYVWGNLILLVTGGGLLYWAYRRGLK